MECPFNGVTKYGGVWRKVPESDAGSVECPFNGVTKYGGVWRKVPESDDRSVGPSSCVVRPLKLRRVTAWARGVAPTQCCLLCSLAVRNGRPCVVRLAVDNDGAAVSCKHMQGLSSVVG